MRLLLKVFSCLFTFIAKKSHFAFPWIVLHKNYRSIHQDFTTVDGRICSNCNMFDPYIQQKYSRAQIEEEKLDNKAIIKLIRKREEA